MKKLGIKIIAGYYVTDAVSVQVGGDRRGNKIVRHKTMYTDLDSALSGLRRAFVAIQEEQV